MTLNANFGQASAPQRQPVLDGPERVLDVLVGLVIIVVELLVGFLLIYSLYALALEQDDQDSSIGFFLAIAAAGTGFVITTLVYLARAIRGQRSWGAPLLGLIVLAVASAAGYFISTAGISTAGISIAGL